MTENNCGCCCGGNTTANGDNIKEFIKEKYGQAALNAGQRKQASCCSGGTSKDALARTLANSPSIILADEPTGNLDPATADGVAGMLKDLND